jgi:subtilisin-like proprotein convertase family protein
MTKTMIRTAGTVLAAFAMTFAAHGAKDAPAAQQQAMILEEAIRLKPVASSIALQPYTAVAELRVAELDLKAIEIEDEVARVQGEPPRYAIPMPVKVTPATDGTWEDGLDSDGRPVRVWRFRTGCDNARNINLGFTRFRLPASATLFVYSPDMAHVVRGFSARDNNVADQLWTPPVPGSEVVVELAVSPKEADRVVLELGSINPGYRTFGKDIGGGESALSGSCNVDVVCPEGDAWRDEIAAVAVISTGGSRFCTGFMVNNVRQDLTPYFMTANHCGVSASNAPSLVAFWNYENSTCRTPGSPQSGGAGNGSLAQFNTGSTWLASYSPSDMTLVRLNAQPNAAWNVAYAGWDARPGDAPQSVCIHHPDTDEKRISFDNEPATTTTYLQNAVPGDGTHIRIIEWNLGTTEPGSSGSPLFNPQRQVTGQLHGGFASCTSDTSDWYGRMSVSWLGGGTNSSQLKVWLDPDNTGALQLNTLSTRGIGISPSGNVVHQGVLGGPFTNDPFTYTLTNSTPAARTWSAQVTGGLDLLLNGASSTGGTLQPGQSAQLVVTLGASVATLPAGTYNGAVVVTDGVSGVSRTMQHSVEAGLTSITVGPSDGLETGGPLGGPFTGSVTYTVTSTSPSPVSVSVTGNAPWISVDGGASSSFTLSSQGATRTVVVGIGSAAQSLDAGVYNGAVTFANSSGGTGGSTRTVKLEVGRVVYAATGLPLPVNDNATINSTIAVPDGFCIGDVDVDVNLTHTYVGDLAIDLISPTGTVVRLHNRTGGTTDNIVARFDDDGGGRAPDGPGALGDLDQSTAAGTWTLRVADQANGDVGSLVAWSLRMVPQGSVCQSPVVFLSEPLDSNPGWATEGQWAFGVPTGAGGDPTSGNTGSNVYGYNLAGQYPNGMPVYHLVSTPFDCRGFTGVRVSFFRRLGIESATYDKASFSVSTDAKTWTTVWNHTGGTINDTTWTRVSYNISAVADGQQYVYLRWTIGPTDSSVTYAGWNIDDVEFLGFAADVPCPGDVTDDGIVDGGDLGAMLAFWGACPSGCTADLNQDGIVDGGDLGAMLSFWGPCPN